MPKNFTEEPHCGEQNMVDSAPFPESGQMFYRARLFRTRLPRSHSRTTSTESAQIAGPVFVETHRATVDVIDGCFTAKSSEPVVES